MSWTHVVFPCGYDLTLEGELHLPDGAGYFPGAVVCHPHPLYGGNMYNNLIISICEELAHSSIAALRFNFRGVGRSGGAFGRGIDEQEDVRAALSFLLTNPNVDPERIGLVGYSFGGMVATNVAPQAPGFSNLALVSPALSNSDWLALDAFQKPKLVIIGDADTIILAEQVQRHVYKPDELQIVPGGDHFWIGFEDTIAQRVACFLTESFG